MLNFWAGPGKPRVKATLLMILCVAMPKAHTLVPSPPLSFWVPLHCSTNTLLSPLGVKQPTHLQCLPCKETIYSSRAAQTPRVQRYRRCHVNFVAYGVIFPPKATKRKFKNDSEAIKGGPLGLCNQGSQHDLFSLQKDRSKYKLFSTCGLATFA